MVATGGALRAIVEEEPMEIRRVGLAGALALCLAAAAAAGPKQSLTVELRSPATLNGKELPAGTYKVSWTGEGSNVKVTFANGKKFTIETPGKFVERETQAVDDGVVSRKNGSGSLEISEVRFGGEKRVLVLGT